MTDQLTPQDDGPLGRSGHVTEAAPTRPLEPVATAPVPTHQADRRRPFAVGAALSAGVLAVAGVAATMGAAPTAESITGAAGLDGTALNLSTGSTVAVAESGWVYDGPGLGRHGGRAGFGSIEVTAVSGTSVSLRTEDGWTRTVTVTDDVTITEAGVEIEVGDIEVGDAVRLGQTRNDDGTWILTDIVVVVPTSAGTVTAVDADSITIRGRNGTTEEIATTPSTVYRLGPNTGTRADLIVGAAIIAAGTEDADGDLTATTVIVQLPKVGGQVTAKTSSTITIEQRDGSSLTIHVDADTDYTVSGDEDATLADVTVDMWLIATGQERSDGSIDAVTIRAATGGDRLGRGFGPGFGPGRGHGGGGWGDPDVAPDADADDSATS